MKPAERVFGGNGALIPWEHEIVRRRGDEFNEHSIGIGKTNDFLVEPRDGRFDRDVMGEQAFALVANRITRNRESGRFHFARSAGTWSGIRPREESKDRSRRPGRIAEVEVITSRIVKINGSLHEPHPEQSDIEVEIALWIGSDRGDVMEAHEVHDLGMG